MGYSLSYEEAKKRENYCNKVYALRDRFLKFDIEYTTGDRSEVYKPILFFPEYVSKSSRIYLYLQVGIRKANKLIESLESGRVNRDKVIQYVMKNGVNLIR